MACQVFPKGSLIDVMLAAHRAGMIGCPSLAQIAVDYVGATDSGLVGALCAARLRCGMRRDLIVGSSTSVSVPTASSLI